MRSLASDFGRAIAEVAADPPPRFARYRDDPVAFAVEVLGVTLWEGQREVLQALTTSRRVTVRAGRGIGKSVVDGIAALWYLLTRRPGCRVVLMGASEKTVEGALWPEVCRLAAGARVSLGLALPTKAQTGLRFSDGRELVGIVANPANPVQIQGLRAHGVSDMLVVIDEASGVSDLIESVIFGNLSGGATLLYSGNPTKAEGFFYESHRGETFTKLHLSVLESPNVVAGREVIPGLTERAWVDEARAKWGEGSQHWSIYVLGEFVTQVEGRLFHPGAIAAAEERWASTEATGPLYVSCDPAGEGQDGDESAFCARRGNKVLDLYTRRGLSSEAILLEVVGLISLHRGGSWEVPRFVYDREGSVGAKLHAVTIVHHERHRTATSEPFHPIGVRSSEKPKKRPNDVHSLRDELWFDLLDRFGTIGIPANMKLEGDLAAVRFDKLVQSRSKIIDKKIMRQELGRSPDLGDALSLAFHEGPAWVDEAAATAAQSTPVRVEGNPAARPVRPFDPYAGGRGGGFDPYQR